MRKGERALFQMLPSYAFGSQGAGVAVPGNAIVKVGYNAKQRLKKKHYDALLQKFDIELVDFSAFVAVDKHNMNVTERLQTALQLKEKGNAMFKQKKIAQAIDFYSKVQQSLIITIPLLFFHCNALLRPFRC